MNNQLKVGGHDVTGVQLVLAGRGYNREYRTSYNRYRVLITLSNGVTQAIEDMFDREELKKHLAYWSTRGETLSMTCWGTSQEFEAQLALGGFLNMQIEGEDWGDYTRRVRNLVQVI